MSDYEHDFYEWTQAQAALIRTRRWTEVDADNLAEEVEDLGKRDRRAVESYLEVIVLHLLKWACQPERRSRSWEKSLLQARHRLHKLLRESPSLQRQLYELLSEAYPYARHLAAIETGLPETTFRSAGPWPVDQVLDEHFLPEAVADGR
jgi:hypothetical protein